MRSHSQSPDASAEVSFASSVAASFLSASGAAVVLCAAPPPQPVIITAAMLIAATAFHCFFILLPLLFILAVEFTFEIDINAAKYILAEGLRQISIPAQHQVCFFESHVPFSG